MSDQNTNGIVNEPAPLTPADFVLQTFNIFENGTFDKLSNITEYLSDFRSEDFKNNIDSKVTMDPSGSDTSTYTETSSKRESNEKIAASFGLSGSYGFYSGSVQTNINTDEYNLATAFSANYFGTIDRGAVHITNATSISIGNFIAAFQEAMTNIDSLQKAKDFIESYGTHVATGWNVGGAFSMSIAADTSTYSDKTSISVKVTGKYQAINSVSAAATAAYDLYTSGSISNLNQEAKFYGGNPDLASQIDLKSSPNISDWAKSCSTSTISGIYEAIDMAELATQNGLTIAATNLKRYTDLYLLKFSLENPTILTSETPLVAGTSVDATVTCDNPYKIVSGGASVGNLPNANSFLTACYPTTSTNSQGLLSINGWRATSHDCISDALTDNNLTVYAIAIFDPGGYLNVFVSRDGGSNPKSGTDTANSPNWPRVPGFTLTGGGCQTIIVAGVFPKYITANCPYQINGQWIAWNASVTDYMAPASGVELLGYAIGIKSDYLSINSVMLSSTTAQAMAHGNMSQQLDNGLKIIGGGVQLSSSPSSWLVSSNNLVRQSFPSASDTWTEFNKDLDGLSHPVFATAFAIGLSVSINGIA
ncbi:MAG: hypothetical protein COW03_16895 [Cytophagales bacterium CG12_big_fil_rev_8_21_14_0_65_40_12]|nr:MAG: hypothetical protein COW03_16895 [Cytophagales bacterium CG12_big_fil_rev_8_21_14_0_65_40_12]PIW04511.1 MAG: hypothetical protein COW40_09460 [Cytophagales bacterium CG17_big_fil_post_rev_8_21_14_2_50_40_13]